MFFFSSAQQSYCCHAGVCRLSVVYPSVHKTHFLGNRQVNKLTPNFVERYLSTISSSIFCLYLQIYFLFFFLRFFFSFSSTWDHMGANIPNDISSESTHQIQCPQIMHTSREGLYQSCSKNCEFVSFSLTCDHMGIKLQMTSSLKEHTGFAPQNSYIFPGRFSAKFLKRIVIVQYIAI